MKMKTESKIPKDSEKEIGQLLKKGISFHTIARKYGIEEPEIMFYYLINKRRKGFNRKK